MKQRFDVLGMTCSACGAHVEKAVAALECVDSVAVSLLTNSMQVEFKDEKVDIDAVVLAVEKAGYSAKKSGDSGEQKSKTVTSEDNEQKNTKFRIISSIALLIPLMYLSMGHMIGLPLPAFLSGHMHATELLLTQFILTLFVVFINRKFYSVGFRTLFRGAPNMDSLIAIGSGAALLYSTVMLYASCGLDALSVKYPTADISYSFVHNVYFESAAMILALVTIGKYLEARSAGKTSAAIKKLMELAPSRAIVLRDGKEIEIPSEQVIPGDVVVIKPGAKIPVDGVVLEGYAVIDESALTGESIPVEKTAGDSVTGATINNSGAFTMRATKVGSDTALAQIIRLVEDASASKAPVAKLADKVSGVFVPIVILIAVITFIAWILAGKALSFALGNAIAVLVISCPCALGLATPTAVMVGMGKGAENGILFKSAESLELLRSVSTIVLDKTGTVTEGKPKVTDIFADGISESELLFIAGSAEQRSEHPLSRAIIEKCESDNINLSDITDFHNESGSGISAVLGGKTVIAGNAAWLEKNNVNLKDYKVKGEELAKQGKTPLYFAYDGELSGIIAVSDTIRQTSAKAIEDMQKMGIEVIMLTGDNHRTAEAIRAQTGISRVIAEVLPQDKEKEIRRLKESGKKVAMIGDGINDAPALARADVGFAIGAGTDIAIESADVVLIKSDLTDAVTAIKLSRAVMRNVKQNLFWAFFYNAICIPLAAGVFYPLFNLRLSPMIGAAAMSLSSFCVVSNALRLRLFKSESGNNINKEGEKKMEKKMIIDGMACGHCSARVEQVLNAIDGVSATVVLEEKCANITLTSDVSDDVLKAAVTDAGYTVVSLS
ncbi:MAG: heavy metal translocating P-type ATPase [Clostridia bacterium]|nr:heavy metal translocating P-type ATPase [Clostridia bacterium]